MKGKGKDEATVLKECMFFLKRCGIYHWRQNTGAFQTKNGGYFRSSMPGVSDILGILPDGRFLAVECKRENGGVLSNHQKEFLSNIAGNKGIAVVVRNAQELEQQLGALGYASSFKH